MGAHLISQFPEQHCNIICYQVVKLCSLPFEGCRLRKITFSSRPIVSYTLVIEGNTKIERTAVDMTADLLQLRYNCCLSVCTIHFDVFS